MLRVSAVKTFPFGMPVRFPENIGLKKPFGLYKRIGTGNGGLKLDLFDITLQIQYTLNNDSQKKHPKKKNSSAV